MLPAFGANTAVLSSSEMLKPRLIKDLLLSSLIRLTKEGPTSSHDFSPDQCHPK